MPEETKKENFQFPNMSSSIGKLAAALSKAQGAMKPAPKDSENPYYKSTYADLASIWEAVRQPIADNELAVIQTTEGEGESMVLITTLVHASGEWMRGFLKITPVDKEGKLKRDPQSVGSAISYARRYALSAILGVAAEDDDGNVASGKDQPKQPQGAMAPQSKSGQPAKAQPQARPQPQPEQGQKVGLKLIEGGLTESDIATVTEAIKISNLEKPVIMAEIERSFKKKTLISLTPQEGAQLVTWLQSHGKSAP